MENVKPLMDSAPEIADSAFVSELAYLIGAVTLEERSSVWPYVCLRGDFGDVRIGSESNIQEHSMIHGATIGDRVTVGHNVTIDYATIEDDSLIGISSVVLEDAIVESECIVAAGSVVLGGQTIPAGHLAYGIPAETRPINDSQQNQIRDTYEHYVELSRTYLAAGIFE